MITQEQARRILDTYLGKDEEGLDTYVIHHLDQDLVKVLLDIANGT